MKNYISLLSFALITGFLFSCATLNKNECRNADWQTIGYEDGIQGALNSRVGKHREACAKHGVKVELQQYNLGHQQGVIMYCKGSRGFEEGLQGKIYNSVCPANLEADFLLGFASGREIYELKDQRSDIEQEINQNLQKIKEAKETISKHKAEIISDATTVDRRIVLWELIGNQQRLIKRVEVDNEDLLEEKEILTYKIEDRLRARIF